MTPILSCKAKCVARQCVLLLFLRLPWTICFEREGPVESLPERACLSHGYQSHDDIIISIFVVLHDLRSPKFRCWRSYES